MSKLRSTEELMSLKLEKPEKNILKGQKTMSFTENNEKERSFFQKNTKKISLKDKVIDLLQKTSNIRNPRDIKIISDYFVKYFEYFRKIKKTDPEKLDKLCKVVNLERFTKGDPIIQFGEIGEKFYIVFSGSVQVYKPNYIEKVLPLGEFCSYMFQLKKENLLKYNRILNKNKYLNLDMGVLEGLESETFYMRRKMKFLLEELELLGEFKDGFAFGEIALIKKTKRNATIISNDNSYLLSINKSDYNKMIRELEVKRLEKEINTFKIDFPLFENLGEFTIIEFLNCFNHIKVGNGDMVFNQNDDDDNIYFIKNGTFKMYSLVSFSWINQFLSYIIDSKQNTINLMEINKLKQDNDIIEMIDIAKKSVIPSPFKNAEFQPRLLISNKEKDSPIDIKKDEEQLCNPHKLFHINVKVIDYKDILGFEDTLELKNKFYSLKCISTNGELNKIHLVDFLRIIHKLNDQNLRNLLKNTIITKKIIFFQSLKNSLTKKAFKLQDNFQSRYEYIVQNGQNIPNEKISDEKVVSMKISGWTKNIDDILEQDIYLTRGKKRIENPIFTKIKEQFIRGNKKGKLVSLIKSQINSIQRYFPNINNDKFKSGTSIILKSRKRNYSNNLSPCLTNQKESKNMSISTNMFSSYEVSKSKKENKNNINIHFSPIKKMKKKKKESNLLQLLYKRKTNELQNELKTEPVKEILKSKSEYKMKYDKSKLFPLDINKKNILGVNFCERMNLKILKNPVIYTQKAINSANFMVYK